MHIYSIFANTLMMKRKKTTRKGKDAITRWVLDRKTPILVSVGNVIALLVLTYVLNNQPLFTGENLNMFAWAELLKNKTGLSEKTDYKDALFINVSYDKQLIDKNDDMGMPVGNTDITDRSKLLNILNRLDSIGQHRYIILDVRFEKGYDSEADSALFAKLKGMNNITIASHKDIELADSALKKKAAISDYASTIVATNFTRYKYLYDSQPSMPLYAYREMTGKTITRHGFLYTCDGRLCHNSAFLNFPSKAFSEYDESGNKTYYNLGSDILESYSDSDLAVLTKDKMVFIGDMTEDVHDTYSGLKPGSVITYHALHSLLNGKHLVSCAMTVLLALLFFIISLSLFSHRSLADRIPLFRNSRSRALRFLLSFAGYALVLYIVVAVLYFFFDTTISILIPSLYFAIQKTIINYKRTKI